MATGKPSKTCMSALSADFPAILTVTRWRQSSTRCSFCAPKSSTFWKIS